jgi:hypothetical protein
MPHPTGFFNTVVSPNLQRTKRGRNVPLSNNPAHWRAIPMVV